MQRQHIRGAGAFQELAAEWDTLVDAAMTATPFQKLGYQQAWWAHLGPGELHTLAFRGAGGQLCAIACFYLLDGILYFNGCVEETDYLDIISPETAAAEVWRDVFTMLEQPDFPAWRGLSLCNVPDSSPSPAILKQLCSERGYEFQSEIQDVCPVIDLPATFDEYLMNLDKKQRHEIRRKMRRATGASVGVHQVDQATALSEGVDEFLRLLQLSTTEKEDWLTAGRRAVFHDVARAALADGTLQLLFLRKGDDNAAALYNFDYKGRIWVYNSGFDIVEFGHLSPGVVLTSAAIEVAIQAGRDTFDFLRGNEEYKYRFGAHDTHIYRLQIHRQP